MPESITELVALSDSENPCNVPWDELEPLWIDAMDLRFQECRSRIPVLEQLAQRAGIDTVRSLDDIVPLLFAHTAYKSYPEAFVRRGRWDRMNVWLDTLSKRPVGDIGVEGVGDADEWLARLHSAGHPVFTTSGTSGKHSFINQSEVDVAFSNKVMLPSGVEKDRSRPIFVLGPRKAPNRASAFFSYLADTCGRPDAVYFLTDDELRITDLSQMMTMRKRIAEGVAKPSEIAEFEQAMKARGGRSEQLMARMIDAIIDHRSEPSIIVGLTPQLWSVVQAARERGLTDGCFHPDTVVVSGGGAKGFDLPEDHVEQIMRFMGLGLDRFTQGYGMQEVSTGGRMLEWGRYSFPGWIVPLVLDDTGENLIRAREGTVTGRMAIFDVSIDGRWGGTVTGDRVTVDFSPSPEGRAGPSVLEIARYSELEGGDDKLTCAGTIVSFVRGAVGD
jgi:hypothetical protein